MPDQIVVDELTTRGDVFRTDRDDASCKTDDSKIGTDADDKADGCDNIRVQLGNTISSQYLEIAD